MLKRVRCLPVFGAIRNLHVLIGIVGLLFFASSAYSQTTTCFEYDGTIQTWTVPAGVSSITVEAWGAQGGNSTWATPVSGGLGAYMKGTFSVGSGDVLKILVGGQGESLAVGGGGGGSFVATFGDVPLLVAGGGGGASSDQPGVEAVTSENGTADSLGIISGGSSGSGGNVCGSDQNDGGGGGGFFSDGADANNGGSGNGGFGGMAFVNGGGIAPGGRLDGACDNDPAGGFGGGGSATCNTVGGGGGGGYSGGAGGPHISNCGAAVRAGGGGGGSFNDGTNQTNIAGDRSGNGRVCITYSQDVVRAAIPTLSGWALVLFGLLLGMAGIVAIKSSARMLG